MTTDLSAKTISARLRHFSVSYANRDVQWTRVIHIYTPEQSQWPRNPRFAPEEILSYCSFIYYLRCMICTVYIEWNPGDPCIYHLYILSHFSLRQSTIFTIKCGHFVQFLCCETKAIIMIQISKDRYVFILKFSVEKLNPAQNRPIQKERIDFSLLFENPCDRT